MVDDLRDAGDRLKQTPQNSSRPSGSYAPWQQATFRDKEGLSEGRDKVAEPKSGEKARSKKQPTTAASNPKRGKRKAGKQAGAKGVGRSVGMSVTGEVIHQGREWAACGEALGNQVLCQAKTGLSVLDIERSEQGLPVTQVKQL